MTVLNVIKGKSAFKDEYLKKNEHILGHSSDVPHIMWLLKEFRPFDCMRTLTLKAITNNKQNLRTFK